MKILKRTKAMKDAHIAHGIRSFLTHFKIRERIDRMNQWARRSIRSVQSSSPSAS